MHCSFTPFRIAALSILLFNMCLAEPEAGGGPVAGAPQSAATFPDIETHAEIKAELATKAASFKLQRRQFYGQMRAYLATVPQATPEQLEVMQAAFIRNNFEAFLALEELEQDVNRLRRKNQAFEASKRESIIMQSSLDGTADVDKIYAKGAEKLLKLESTGE